MRVICFKKTEIDRNVKRRYILTRAKGEKTSKNIMGTQNMKYTFCPIILMIFTRISFDKVNIKKIRATID